MAETRNARETALKILTDVERGAYADRALNRAFSEANLDSRNTRFVTEVVNGLLRMRGHIDWVLNRYVKGGIEKRTPQIRNALRLGAYQILFLDKVPDPVAVNETVILAKRFGRQWAANLCNAVLRKVAERGFTYPALDADPVSHLSVFHSHPEWLVKRWIERFGVEETRELCRANNRVPDIVLRFNSLKGSIQDAIAFLARDGIETRNSPYLPAYLRLNRSEDCVRRPTFERGWFVAQDESAGLATLLLDPHPGERVLDLCSAPGGKTTHVAELMRNEGTLVAVDIHGERLQLVERNCNCLGIGIVETVRADGTEFVAEPFQRILVDAPCTNTGVLARRADARWRKQASHLSELPKLQKKLLDHAVQILKKDGILVYSTCSMEEEENERVVKAVLERHPEMKVEDASSFVAEEFIGLEGYVRTFPHRHGLDGIFAARMRKTE